MIKDKIIQIWKWLVSLYIGKDSSGSKNIIHITSDVKSDTALKSNVYHTTLLHSGYSVFNVLGVYRFDLDLVEDGYVPWFQYWQSNNALIVNEHLTSGKLFLIHTYLNGVHTTSNIFGRGAYKEVPIRTICPKYGDVNDKLVIELDLAIDYHRDQIGYIEFVLIDYVRNAPIITANGGAVGISAGVLDVNTSWNLSTNKILCEATQAVTNEQFMQTDVAAEWAYSIKNYSGGTSYSFSNNLSTVYKDGVPFIGGIAGNILTPIAKERYILDANGATHLGVSSYATMANCVIINYTVDASPDVYMSAGGNIANNPNVLMKGPTVLFTGWIISTDAIYIAFNRSTGSIDLTSLMKNVTIDIVYFY